MKLTKGKISKLYNKKKQSLKKNKLYKKGESSKKKTFRRKKRINLANSSLKKFHLMNFFGGQVDKDDVSTNSNLLASNLSKTNQQDLQNDSITPEVSSQVSSQETSLGVPPAISDNNEQLESSVQIPENVDSPKVNEKIPTELDKPNASSSLISPEEVSKDKPSNISTEEKIEDLSQAQTDIKPIESSDQMKSIESTDVKKEPLFEQVETTQIIKEPNQEVIPSQEIVQQEKIPEPQDEFNVKDLTTRDQISSQTTLPEVDKKNEAFNIIIDEISNKIASKLSQDLNMNESSESKSGINNVAENASILANFSKGGKKSCKFKLTNKRKTHKRKG
jgi:hypothetical protein